MEDHRRCTHLPHLFARLICPANSFPFVDILPDIQGEIVKRVSPLSGALLALTSHSHLFKYSPLLLPTRTLALLCAKENSFKILKEIVNSWSLPAFYLETVPFFRAASKGRSLEVLTLSLSAGYIKFHDVDDYRDFSAEMSDILEVVAKHGDLRFLKEVLEILPPWICPMEQEMHARKNLLKSFRTDAFESIIIGAIKGGQVEILKELRKFKGNVRFCPDERRDDLKQLALASGRVDVVEDVINLLSSPSRSMPNTLHFPPDTVAATDPAFYRAAYSVTHVENLPHYALFAPTPEPLLMVMATFNQTLVWDHDYPPFPPSFPREHEATFLQLLSDSIQSNFAFDIVFHLAAREGNVAVLNFLRTSPFWGNPVWNQGENRHQEVSPKTWTWLKDNSIRLPELHSVLRYAISREDREAFILAREEGATDTLIQRLCPSPPSRKLLEILLAVGYHFNELFVMSLVERQDWSNLRLLLLHGFQPSNQAVTWLFRAHKWDSTARLRTLQQLASPLCTVEWDTEELLYGMSDEEKGIVLKMGFTIASLQPRYEPTGYERPLNTSGEYELEMEEYLEDLADEWI